MKLVLSQRRLQGALALNLCLLLAACGKAGSVPASAPAQSAAPAAHSAVDSDGQPVVETAETIGPDFDDVATQPAAADDRDSASESIADSIIDVGARVGYQLPEFQASWGLSRAVYDKAVTWMDMHSNQFTNQRYVVLVDMSQHSSKKRMYLFDLQTGKLERHNVAHGSGSDPRATGYAKLFANAGGSEKTSLGAYKATATYQGKHGLQLRLAGLESSNSAALQRGIVLHGARYVSDNGHAGRSWGCPAMDPRVISSVIARLKGGAFLLIWK